MTDLEHTDIDLYKELPSPSIGEGQGVGIDLAFDAAAWLWDILHDDDGIERVEGASMATAAINTALLALTDQVRELRARDAALRNIAADLRAQRDLLGYDLAHAKRSSDDRVRNQIIRALALEHGISEMQAQYILEALMGDGDFGITDYDARQMRRFVEEAAESIATELDMEESAEYAEDEDF